MRISEHYELDLQQPSLEFVDVDIVKDTRAFIDPKALKDIDTPWAQECVSLLQDFFATVLLLVQQGKEVEAQKLLSQLSEPNETRLGLSRDRANGSAVGEGLSEEISKALTGSEAATSGLLEDLEDTALFIPGISFDRISDMTTNIIRSQLIHFTAQMSAKYPSIALVPDTYVGPTWDRRQHKWTTQYQAVPAAGIGPLLLVPKSIVRRKKTTFNPGDYLTHHILPELQHREFAANSSLVETLKNGKQRVTKKSVKQKVGLEAREGEISSEFEPRTGKDVNLEVTLSKPELLDEYRQATTKATPLLTHDQIADVTHTPPPDWDQLLDDVLSVPPGKSHATQYHLAVERLLTALFYPALEFMKHEYPLYEGRKRVDITYTNLAREGFFDWVNRVVRAPAHDVYVECKNYIKDVGNPELDQIVGRFSQHRSRLGLMVYRSTSNQERIEASCRDTALAGNGFVLALCDDDLVAMVDERKKDPDSVRFAYLEQKYRRLV